MAYIEGESVEVFFEQVASRGVVVNPLDGVTMTSTLFRQDNTPHGTPVELVYTAPPDEQAGWSGILQLPDNVGEPGTVETMVVQTLGVFGTIKSYWETRLEVAARIAGE